LYETLKQIGKELFTYFLKLYPENSIVSLCISENNFNDFLKDKDQNKFNSELQLFFYGEYLPNEYATLTVAVYQTSLVVKKNINNDSAYNKVLIEELGINLNQIEHWYRDNQKTIWVDKLSKKFKENNRVLLLPNPKFMLGHKHIRYPILQFLIDKEKYNYILKKHEPQIDKLKTMPFEEFSKRVFSSYNDYYDVTKATNYLRLKDFSKNDLNNVAKKIIYSFIIDDINFNPINTKISKKLKNTHRDTTKTQQSNQIILIENMENKDYYFRNIKHNTEVDIRVLGSSKIHLFIYDYQQSHWIHKKRKTIKTQQRYGVLLHLNQLDLLQDLEFKDYATDYLVKDNYYFIKLKTNYNALNQISNSLFFQFVEEQSPNLIGGLKKGIKEYYNFALPTLMLPKSISQIFINDESILIKKDQNTIDLNKCTELLHEGNNIVKTVKSKLAEFTVYTPSNNDYDISIDKGWYFYSNKKITKEKDYHLNGFFSTKNLSRTIKNNNLSTKKINKYNPILHLINKNIYKNLKKGNKLYD
jgi:hypothetical protein